MARKWNRASQARAGLPYIPDRSDLNTTNRAARESAANRKKGKR